MTFSPKENGGVRVVRSRTILQPPGLLYRFWRDPTNLEKIISHPVEITAISSTESHWRVSAPFRSTPLEWDAVITDDVMNCVISWRTRQGAEIAHTGSVCFEPRDAGTKVTVSLEYEPPCRKWMVWITRFSSREPGRQVADALHRLKALIETPPTSDVVLDLSVVPVRSN